VIERETLTRPGFGGVKYKPTAEYAVARKSYSRSRIVAGPDGPVLATRERGLQAKPSSIYDAAEENSMM